MLLKNVRDTGTVDRLAGSGVDKAVDVDEWLTQLLTYVKAIIFNICYRPMLISIVIYLALFRATQISKTTYILKWVQVCKSYSQSK